MGFGYAIRYVEEVGEVFNSRFGNFPEPTPVFSPNRLRFLVVATITGSLLTFTIGVRTASTGLRILTLPRTLTSSTSSLRASVLRVGTTRATGSQSVVSKRVEKLFFKVRRSSSCSGMSSRLLSCFLRNPFQTSINYCNFHLRERVNNKFSRFFS